MGETAMQSQLIEQASIAQVREHSYLQRRNWRFVAVALAIGDLLVIMLGFGLAYALRFWTGWEVYEVGREQPGFYAALVALLAPLWVGIFALYGLYDLQKLFYGPQEYARIFNACLLGVMLVVMLSFIEPDFVIARAWLMLSWTCILLFVFAWRFAARRAAYLLRTHGHFTERVVILGANGEGQAIAAQLRATPSAGARVVGFIDERLPIGSELQPGLTILGTSTAFQAIVDQYQIDTVIIADTELVRDRLATIYDAMATLRRLDVRLAPGLFELLTIGVEVREQGSVPLLSLNKTRITGLHAYSKAFIDRLGAAAGLLLLSPILLLAYLAVRLDSPGPVIYRRRVVGAGHRSFDAFKFRTMHLNGNTLLSAEQQAELEREGKLKNDPRITRVGKWLRKTSIDELPQLFNVLLGDMSLVGPRMLTYEELRHFGRWQHNLLTVRPGLTGLWQISGRSNLGYEDRVRLDMHYIRNYSIWLDLSIIVRTIPIVFTGHGAY
jgi:exopolysaccharide biosynthesis polyprenyl glycosylphosphotransferase